MSNSKNKNATEQVEKIGREIPETIPEKLPNDVKRLRSEVKKYKKLNAKLIAENEELRTRLALVEEQYYTVQNSEFWKITKPFRWALDGFKRMMRKTRVTNAIYRGLACLKDNGVRYTIRRVRAKMSHKGAAKRPLYTKEELEAQKLVTFSKEVKFSILVPLYNTPEKYLKEMVQSVLDQTYANWELCLADGSDENHKHVGQLASRMAAGDSRILYRKLEKNLGISGNTNACIDMASGDFIALFDHDDILHPAALFEMMTAICEKDADFVYTDENTFHKKIDKAYCPHHKPDFSPDLLRSYNYICHFTAFSRELLERVGGFRPEFDGSQDYDMILRLTEQAKNIVHIPKILYFWRSHPGSVAASISAKPYTIISAKKALSEHLKRVGLEGTVTDSRVPSTYRIRYRLTDEPLISIIIPNMDHVQVLKKCIDSVEKLSTYRNFEILIVENNSKKQTTFHYYETVCRQYSNIRLIKWPNEFNYSKINNFAAKHAKGDYLLFLNNDIEIITPNWLEEMLMFNQREDVGATGVMLYYPDNTVQHAGVIMGIGGIAGHSHKYYNRNAYGYMSRMSLAQNLSAVTAACMMVRASLFHELEGFDETLQVAFNDVDLCMKIRRAGYLIVFTPYAEAYHYESKSRGAEDTPEKQRRFAREIKRFREKWDDVLEAGDPYYNPNLSLEFEDFRLK